MDNPVEEGNPAVETGNQADNPAAEDSMAVEEDILEAAVGSLLVVDWKAYRTWGKR